MPVALIIFELPDVLRRNWNLEILHGDDRFRGSTRVGHHQLPHLRQGIPINGHTPLHHGRYHPYQFICNRKFCRLQSL